MSIFEFMSDSPFLSFFIAGMIINGIISIPKMVFRYLNIRKYGYPPVHCTADGLFRKKE